MGSDTKRTIHPYYIGDTDPTPTPPTQYTTERDKISRTRQVVVEMAMVDCQNAYAQPLPQWLLHTQEFDDTVWVSSGVTVTADTIVAPDGSVTGDTLAFAAEGDSITQAGG